MRLVASARGPVAATLIVGTGLLVTSLGLVACGHPATPRPTAAAPAPVQPINGPLGGSASCLTSDVTNSLPPVDVIGPDRALLLRPKSNA